MADEILDKQPSESRLYDIDFAPLLAIGNSLTGAATVTTTQNGLTIGAPVLATPLVQVRLSSGTDGTLYKLTVKCSTSDGDDLETDIYLRVEDR